MDNTALLAILTPQIDREENCRLESYLDTKGVWTIGWGRADAGVTKGMTCTQAQADHWRDIKLNGVCGELDAALPWWRTLSLTRQAVLAEMAYQLGTHGLLGFPRALGYIHAGAWADAKAALLDSKWARLDSPKRAAREAQQMLTGVVTAA
jgi:lysozyme